MAATPESVFRNLIPCDSFEYPFVDAFSQFAVVFERGRPMGPVEVQVRSCVLYQAVADALLTLWVADSDGTGVPVTRRETEHLPWGVTERGDVPGAEITASHLFLDHRTMLSEFHLSLDHDAPPDALRSLEFRGRLAPEEARHARTLAGFGIPDPPLREPWIETSGEAVTAGISSPARDAQGRQLLPGAALRISCISSAGISTEIAAGDLSWTFAFELRPSSTSHELRVQFVTEFSATSYLHDEWEWTHPGEYDSLDLESSWSLARARFLDRVDWEHPPTVTPLRVNRAWRARWALLRTGYQGTSPAGEFGDLVASTCVPNGGGFTRAFFWDAFFTSAALSTFEPSFAQSAIDVQFVRQLPDGHCPEHVFNFNVAGRSIIGAPQAPVASWAVADYLARVDDAEYLASVYPTLATNFSYWQKKGDRDADGLAEWTWTGQTTDSGPVWDEYRSETTGCNWIPPIASVQLNSFLYRDALLLAEFADRLGASGEASIYRADALARASAMTDHLYLPDERRFWDYYPPTGRHTRIRTAYMFWPIWAGVPMPDAAKSDLIENELLNPDHFFGPIPFPSVAYSEPTYENRQRGRFWRGTAWPQITYWLLQMLVREGYIDAADEAANRFLAAYDKEPSFPEHISSDPRHYAGGGSKDYNWGIAAYLLIAERRYREATPW